jgi:hypothetical protein
VSLTATLLPYVAGAFVLALLLNAWRLLRGPAVVDRILALDTLYITPWPCWWWWVCGRATNWRSKSPC